MSEEGPWTDYPRGADQRVCVNCRKPTGSHAIYLRDTDSNGFEPVERRADSQFHFPVCHTCYELVDGDAEEFASLVSPDEDDVAVEAGIKPSVIKEFGDVDDVDTDRRVAFSDARIREMVRMADPGDVFEFNGSADRWVVIPVTQETLDQLTGEVLFVLLGVGGIGAGGVVMSSHPTDDSLYHAYNRGNNDELELELIEELEYVGKADIDEDVLREVEFGGQ